MDRTLSHGLLLAGGTALLVGVVGQFHAHGLLADADLRSGREQAAQVATILGTDLLEASTMPAGSATTATLERLLADDPRIRSLYTVVRQGDRDVIVLSVGREPERARPSGTPVQLTAHGHRAFRTGNVTLERGPWTIAHVPVRAADGSVRGLLVAEIRPESSRPLSVWTLVVLPLLGAAAMGVWLVVQLVRPLARIRSIFSDQVRDVREPRSLAEAAVSLDDLVTRMTNHKRVLEAQAHADAQHQLQASQARDEVISNTVHELRTPLSTIVAALEILETFDDLPRAGVVEFLAQASAACQHMRFLVNDILDSAAIESGIFAVEAGTCSLNEIFGVAGRVMRPSALASDIELKIEPADPDIQVHADQSRVLQVLFNLLSNAIKYSPSGRTVTLRAVSNELAAVVEIEDEGEGVPLASRAQLFSKFARLAHDHKHAVEGSGIGLYLSKQLIELMNGSIGYRERDGAGETGSVFWFTLPLARERIEPEPAQLEATLDETA